MKKKILKGKSLKLYPNKKQEELLIRIFGSTRWLWNNMLNLQETRFKNGGKFLSRYSLNYILTQVKKEYPWLKEAESTSLINTNEDLAKAYNNFFDGRSKKPRFKAKRNEQSFRINCVNFNIRLIDDKHIRIPIIGIIPFKSSSIPEGRIKSITIRRKPSGIYLASLLMETEIEELPKTNKVCGIDLGLKELAIFDDGTKFPLPRFDKNLEIKVHYWQKICSKRLLKVKEVMKTDESLTLNDFKNYQKARTLKAKYEENIANQRNDYLHKLSNYIVQSYDVIVLEDLKVKLMVKNHKLAKAISNAGWNKLENMIKYKASWYGKTVLQVNPSYTSQTCNKCGCINNKLGYNKYGWLKVRDWQCLNCNAKHDRDINAAINILNKGLALI